METKQNKAPPAMMMTVIIVIIILLLCQSIVQPLQSMGLYCGKEMRGAFFTLSLLSVFFPLQMEMPLEGDSRKHSHE